MDKIKIKFKPMSCPICDEMYFSDLDKDNYEEELDNYIKGEVRCRHCGWIYDLYQAENPDSTDGLNSMSINEYKKWFVEKIKNNPDYDYSSENQEPPTPHKCPVCGEHEFPDTLSSEICPICGWEDTGFEQIPDKKPSPYMMSLNERTIYFKEKRKQNPKYTWIKEK